MVDQRIRTTLLCAAFAIAIAVSILLRSRKNKSHYLLSMFAGCMGLWYLTQFLWGSFEKEIVFFRLTATLSILLPVLSTVLFDALSPQPQDKSSPLRKLVVFCGAPLLVLAWSPIHRNAVVRSAIFIYVFGFVAAGLIALWRRARASLSRAIRERVQILVIVGAAAVAGSILDFVWFIGAEIPPIGAVLAVIFLFVLSESMRREHLTDVYELLGRMVVSIALAFLLAGIFYVFVTWVNFETMYLNAVLAAVAILVLFEPLRAKVEEKIHAIMFRQRRDLELAVRDAQRRLAHVIDLDELGEAIVTALGQSRRLTSVALYLLVPDGKAFALSHKIGDGAAARLEVATLRPILHRLRTDPSIVLDAVARESTDNTEAGAIVTAARVLQSLQSGVILGIKVSGEEVVGLLIVQDDRVRDAFSAEEVALLENLAPMISAAIENSRAYARMKERDRLAALGQMAAGLAHEIKNPLGSIKGAAQLLLEGTDGPLPPASRDFLDIIIEEVDRLDRVVGSALDYARPQEGDPVPLDVNAVVRRTLQIVGPSTDGAIQIEFAMQEDLPCVKIDAEHLRQVLMNLVHNGLHAIGSRGRLTIATRVRSGSLGAWRDDAGAGETSSLVEISVSDTGEGISPKILNSLFVPFFSTKSKGSGLGLAISQRIVRAAGGSIEVASQEGKGSTFTVLLPAVTATVAGEVAADASAAVHEASAQPVTGASG